MAMIGSRITMPFANVTIRASPSRTVSTTKPGTSRVCSAPTSRTADHTARTGATVSMCLVIDAIGTPLGFGRRDRLGTDGPADLRSVGGGIIGVVLGDEVLLPNRPVGCDGAFGDERSERAVGLIEVTEGTAVHQDRHIGCGDLDGLHTARSEERRVGKGRRTRWAGDD